MAVGRSNHLPMGLRENWLQKQRGWVIGIFHFTIFEFVVGRVEMLDVIPQSTTLGSVIQLSESP